MRQLAQIALLAAAALGVSSAGQVAGGVDPFGTPAPDHFRKQRRGKGQNNRRGKGKRSPPKKRPNRLLISKRVRRKHRRAA